jgi:hypothetical protein
MAVYQDNSLFIALTPGIKIRRTDLIITLTSGFSLLAVSLCSLLLKEQIVLLHFLAIPVSMYVVWYAFVSYINPLKKVWPQIDTLRNLTGFMIIAQAAGMFANIAGFQLSHLFMILGAAIIFLGVMFPKEKNKSGFKLKDNKLIVKTNFLSKESEIELSRINNIKLIDKKLTIQLVDGTNSNFDLSDFDQNEIAINRLKEMIASLKVQS